MNTLKSKYRWQAVSHNGDIKNEAIDSSYESIDRDNLRFFNLISRETEEIRFTIEINKGQKLIWRRRYAYRNNGDNEIVHLIGKQENIDGKNYQWIALFFEKTGKVEFFDKFDNNHPFLDEVILLDVEK